MTRDQILDKAIFLIFPSSIPSNNITTDTDMFVEVRKRYPDNIIINLPIGETYSTWDLNNHHYTTDYHKNNVLPNISKLFNLGIETDNIVWNKITNRIPNNLFLETPVWFGDKYHFINHSLNYTSIRSNLIVNDKDIIERDCLSAYHKIFVGSHSICTIEKIAGKNNGKKLFLVCNSQMIPSIPVLAHYYKKIVIIDKRIDFDTRTLYNSEDFDDILFCLWRVPWYSASDYVSNIFLL